MRTVLLLCISAVLLQTRGSNASLAETMADVTQNCCTQGLRYARNHTSQDCSSSVPPEVPATLGSLCIFAMDECCKEYFEKKRYCEDGIELSSRDQCSSSKSASAANCCNECSRGRSDGEKGICKLESKTESADASLASDAYINCCKEAESKTNKESQSSNSHQHKNQEEGNTGVSSICEEYAPNELCAHHCIPVPGSYRCECNPGFMLMSDGRNCREVQKNRCKPRNHCQHKCNDNGVEVKCSCRRGYELQSDGKTCQDIDECISEPPVCLSGTKCKNIQGSYKCIPIKNRPAEIGKCPPGFTRNSHNGVCDDIDECSLPRPPCPRYDCENTVGGYKCGGKVGDPANLPELMTNQMPEDRCPPGFRSGFNEECEDVDECSIHKDDCNPLSQFCINTKGSFFCQDKASKHCSPGFKINKATNMCEDIDECVDSHALCRNDQICVNVPGAYDCKPKLDNNRSPSKCPEGFRIRHGTSTCEDIDECMEGTHLCDVHQNCLNLNGSHECHCKLGYELDITTGACVDVNECATDQNNCITESQRCDNTVGSYLCIRITSCGTGYILHHTTSECEDIDECALGTHNCGHAGPNYQCVNIPGSFRCVRKTSSTTSTTHSPDEYEWYYDESEEESGTENKASSTQPSTTQPSTLPTESDNLPITTVTPLPEVTEKEFVQVTAYTVQPEDKEEVITEKSQSNKDDNQNSVDNTHSYTEPTQEVRPDSYRPPKPNEDRSTPKSDSEVTHVFLENSSEEPVTIKGIQSLDGSVLVDTHDIPKNTWIKLGKEHELGSCENGFERDGYGACVDIDECTTGNHICSGLTETCRNTPGGYVCDCALGFRRDLVTHSCDLISSSSSTSTSTSTTTSTYSPPIVNINRKTPYHGHWSNWGYPVYEPPKTRPFRPRNKCDVGFHWNNKINQCEDINECTNGVASCAAVEKCVNTEGGYRCECPPNWKLDEYRHQCVPMRDTNSFPLGYGNVPVTDFSSNGNSNSKEIIIGSQYGRPGKKYLEPTLTDLGDRGELLKCRWGYYLDDENRCVDINECATGANNCGITQICTNIPGGYTCNCPSGHRMLSDKTCEDIDECSLAGPKPLCSEHAECVNTVGSYQCVCHDGFRSAPANDKICMDVDECTETRSGTLCEHRCNNVWGGYRCSCHRGYRINSDNRTCSDIDECVEFASKNLCVGRCLNEPGSYRCSCPAGYRLSEDKRSCIDIDECEIGEATCSNRSPQNGISEVCHNTRGGYRCYRISCPPGYILQNEHRCTRIQTIWSCPPSDWNCIHQPTTYSYNYITFVSNLYIPDTRVDLFTMRGLSQHNGKMNFQLKLIDVNAPPTVKEKANIHAFSLTSTNTEAVVSLEKSLQGPQSIELELSMEVYNLDMFQGLAVAKIFIVVSEYTF